MLNHYPLWKYIMLISIITIGLLYALPNIYSEDPAIQITGVYGSGINKKTLIQVQNILQKQNIISKSIILEKDLILIRFYFTDMQLRARDILINILGNKFIIALNLAPTIPNWLSILNAKPMKLGLDLRGGIHFLIKVDTDNFLSKLQEQNINNFCIDFREKNIPFNFIRKGDNYSINISFYDKEIRDQAVNYLKNNYNNMIISPQNDNFLHAEMSVTYIKMLCNNVVQQNINILHNRINKIGITEPLIQLQDANYIIVELPGIQDAARAKEILGTTATLEFRLVNTNIDQVSNLPNYIPSDSEIKYTHEGKPIVLYKRAILTGDHIIYSNFSYDENNQLQVNVSLDKIGGDIMSNFTKKNIGKLIATLIVEYKDTKRDFNKLNMPVKEEIINIANIQSHLSNNFRITGISNLNEARQLSLLLRAGILVAPIQFIEECIIGPTLGVQNINCGLKACLISLIMSIFFMIFLYKKFGLISIVALISNLILIIGIMSLLPGITLTLSGIAGIILTLALALDANVLINERIKEELNNNRTIQQAINEGYRNAFNSILDANITMLIKIIILFTLGTGTIRGFAITAGIGVLTSMFTSIFGTRAIVSILYSEKKNIKKLSI